MVGGEAGNGHAGMRQAEVGPSQPLIFAELQPEADDSADEFRETDAISA